MGKFARIFFSALLASVFVLRISGLDFVAILSNLARYGNNQCASIGKAKALYVFLLVSSIGLFLSDLVNATPFESLLKGGPSYFLLASTSLFLVTKFDTEAIFKITIMYSFFTLFSASSQDLGDDSFKFGYGPFVVNLLLFANHRLSKANYHVEPVLNILLCVIICVLSALTNSRLLFVVSILSLLFCYLARRRSLVGRIRWILALPFILILIPLFILLLSVSLSYVAKLGLYIVELSSLPLVSPVALYKTQQQLNGSLGILLSGRIEFFSSILAFMDRPFFGWGSWPIDPNRFYDLSGRELLSSLGYDTDLARYILQLSPGSLDNFIPTHSVLLASFVWGGLCSAIPFCIFLATFVRRFLVEILFQARNLPFYVSFFFANSIWSILFSPLGFTNRVALSLSISIAVSYLMRQQATSFATTHD